MAFAANPFLSERDRQIYRKERRLFLIAVSSGTLLNPLNSSMISMALHSIQETFGIPFTAASWVISVFYLASAIGQPVMGKLGDVFGKKYVFLAGLFVAVIPVVSAAFVSAFSILLILRVIQAVGTSAIYPSGMGLVREHIHYKQAFALAVISVFSSVTVALGPTIGGLAISLGGWPAIFTVNLPFIMISFLLAWFMFPSDEKHERRSFFEVLHQLDVPGIIWFAIGLVLLLLFLLSVKTNVQYVYGVFGIAALLLFVRRELHAEEPFINLRMFQKNITLTWVNVLFITLNIYNYALLFGLPTYFQDEMKLSVPTSGLFMLFIAGFGIIVTPLTGKWVDYAGVTPPLLVGSILMLAGALLLTFLFTRLSLYWTIPVLSIMGMGYGFSNISLQSAMLLAAPPEEVGTASGLFQTSRYIGAIFSSVLLGMIFSKDVTPSNLQILGMILIAVALFSLWMSFRFRKLQRGTGTRIDR
jgi:MFS family permease